MDGKPCGNGGVAAKEFREGSKPARASIRAPARCAARRKVAGCFKLRAMLQHHVPNLARRPRLRRGTGEHRRRPAIGGSGEQVQRIRIFHARAFGLARLSPSALLIAMPSIISMMPRLIPCNSSPAPASISSRKKSVIERTAVSDCPTPTVSTSTFRSRRPRTAEWFRACGAPRRPGARGKATAG